MVPLHWIQQIMAEEIKENEPVPSMISHFAHELKMYRISFRRLFCYDWVCVPLVYTQVNYGRRKMIGMFKVAALATYAYFGFCLFGRQFLESEKGEKIDLILPIFTIVQFFFFVGWFKVDQGSSHQDYDTFSRWDKT